MLLNQIRALLYGINLDMQSTAARNIPKYAIQIQKWEIVYLYLRVVLLGPWSSFNDPQAAWANSGSIITFPGRNKGKRGQGTWLRESEEHSLLSNSPPGIQTTSLLTGNKLHSPSDMRKSEKGISFSFFFLLHGMCYLSSLTRSQTPAAEVQSQPRDYQESSEKCI